LDLRSIKFGLEKNLILEISANLEFFSDLELNRFFFCNFSRAKKNFTKNFPRKFR